MNRSIFPPAAYNEGAQFQHEKQTLFAHRWLLFAASGQMPAAGDIVGLGIGGWPLVVVRGEDGIARAFLNVCRHQSMPVVDQGVGHCEALRCRYHGWTYALDGRLVEAPSRFAPAESVAEIALEAVELAERDGLCLGRVRPGAEPPPPLGFPDRRFAAALATDIDANWKATVEPLLGSAAWCLVFPLALTAEASAGVGIIRQIVPRTFSRTRIIDLIFSADGRAYGAVLGAVREAAAADKAAAEACQARLAVRKEHRTSGPVAEFLARVAAESAG